MRLDQVKVKSFTLLEVLLVIAIIVIISAFSLPIYQLLTVKSDLDTTASNVAQILRRAQLLSQGVVGDSNWGVKVQKGSLTLYKGTSFSSRDTSADELTTLPPEVDVTGSNEVNFGKFYGLPQNSGTITLSAPHFENKNVSINEKGTVSY